MSPEVAAGLQKNILEIYVKPELQRRADAGAPMLEPIWAAQVLLGGAGEQPVVRLNGEVRLLAKTPFSQDWIDYAHVPKDGQSRVVQLSLVPEEAGRRHLTFCQTGFSPDTVVFFDAAGRLPEELTKPPHARAADSAPNLDTWTTMFAEHDRVSGLVLGGINSPNPEMPIEIIMASALQRSRHLLQAYIGLLEQKNLTAASALIRMQLDSAMRINACSLVDDPMKLWDVFKNDRPWREVISTEGKPLTDGYLRDKLSEHFEWAADVYKAMSGYIHLSRPHLEATTEGEDFVGMLVFQGGPGERVTDEMLQENQQLFARVTSALFTICEKYAADRAALQHPSSDQPAQ